MRAVAGPDSATPQRPTIDSSLPRNGPGCRRGRPNDHAVELSEQRQGAAMNGPLEQPGPDHPKRGAPARFRARRVWLVGGLALVLAVGTAVAIILLDRPGARQPGVRAGGVPAPTSASTPTPPTTSPPVAP